jgi:CheY-like chemotaxis protein
LHRQRGVSNSTSARAAGHDRSPQLAPAGDPPVEVALILARASGSRLADAERFALGLPALAGEGLEAAELYVSQAGTLTALLRLASGDGPALRRRLAFWGARAGARLVDLARLGDRDRAAVNANLAQAPTSAQASPDTWAGDIAAFFDAAGALPERVRREAAPPSLVLEVGGPGWEEVRWDAAGQALFVPGALAPPEGDEIRLCLRAGGGDAVRCRAEVRSVRQEARPGLPAGFTLELREPPPQVAAMLDEGIGDDSMAEVERRRAHPRYAVRAPALVAPAGQGDADDHGDLADLAGDDGPPRFLIENLSQGGAFIRTTEVHPPGAVLLVTATLPTGDALRAAGQVACHTERGMGIRWLADAETEAHLAGVVARLAARPRKALVVDDGGVARRMIASALEECGFEVLTAADGVAALRVLSEELLSLDLLVADVWMPNMDGETLLRTVRHAGGESELAIAMVTGRNDPGLASRLERAGADAVLLKELGPQALARAAAAVLERKRKGRPRPERDSS